MLAFHRARFPFFLPLGLVLGAMALPGSAQTAARRKQVDPSQPAQTPAGVDAGWSAEVGAQLRRAEYHFSALEGGRFGAPNRAQDMRLSLGSDGLEVIPRGSRSSPQEEPWRMHLRTKAFGRMGDPIELGSAHVSASENRLELDHGRLSEWFVNDERGLEQGWTIASAPSGVEPLWIGLEVGGDLALRIDDSGRSGVLVDGKGEPRLRYRDLRVYDATERELEARLAPSPNGVGIFIDDAGASYPLRVDPVLTGPAWTAESDQAHSRFGASVAVAGDVNGDGFSDVLVGAYAYDNEQTDEGCVFVYFGSGAGLTTMPGCCVERDQAGAQFGYLVATAGDVNNDGFSDVLVGAPLWDNTLVDAGAVFCYLGSSTGLASTPVFTWSVPVTSGIGTAASTAGDVNGDGRSDVVIGAPAMSFGGVVGGLWLFVGVSTGLQLAPPARFAPQSASNFASALAPAGDVNGDGYDDVVAGAPAYDGTLVNEGAAYLYLGSASGLATTPSLTLTGSTTGARFGSNVATAGDVSGDGYCDVLISATDGGLGAVYLYPGMATGLADFFVWSRAGTSSQRYIGRSMSSAGDVNGDGYGDVIIGSEGAPIVPSDAMLFLGRESFWSPLPADPSWWQTSNDIQTSDWFGYSVSTAGDVNGDGYSDVLVGAPFHDNGQTDEGRALVYMGSGAGLSTSAAWTAESNQTDSHFGVSVATAGDVNGDGYSDVIVGADLYELGRALVYLGSATGLSTSAAWTAESDQAGAGFGASVATAGDVNGDGYSDVIVGARFYDNGVFGEGRVYLYLGSGAGLSTSAAWTAESHQTAANFGGSVATAGDVNGDGYSDVIVGAWSYDSGQGVLGRAFVYLGSGTGLATSAAWTAESDQPQIYQPRFGWSVATAGDVNGDGYSDVIVGAYQYSNGQAIEGRAFLYLGSGAGLSSSADWTAESDQTDAKFGISSATAGDVNGDGYSDVIVGSPTYSNGQAIEGRALLYLGSVAGLSTSAAWTAESDQLGANFGWSVAAAGDVNGDGYNDVLVGSPFYDNGQRSEGSAFLYLGNEGRGGRVLAPQQRRLFGPNPIAALGRSDAPGFRIQVQHPALAGGGTAFLEWEVKALGVAFNGLGLGRSALGQPVDPFSALSFDEMALPGHDHLLPCKWRARVVLEGNQFFPSTPWFSIPDNARTETDLRFPRKYLRRASAP